jgi:hypothetical protein
MLLVLVAFHSVNNLSFLIGGSALENKRIQKRQPKKFLRHFEIKPHSYRKIRTNTSLQSFPPSLIYQSFPKLPPAYFSPKA